MSGAAVACNILELTKPRRKTEVRKPIVLPDLGHS